MRPYFLLALLLLGLTFRATAQGTAAPDSVRLLVVSPLVGEVIDAREKAQYGLFPYYSTDNFQEARFYQALRPDSAITLRTTLKDGRVALRPFSAADYAAQRTRLNKGLPPAARTAAPDSVGQTYRVTLRSGTTFTGILRARRSTELEFDTPDLGRVVTPLANIQAMERAEGPRVAHPNWQYVGNGNRMFFAPTARNLRRGEGYVQDIWIFLVGANYGVTDRFSIGALVSAIPGLTLGQQFLSLTPKVSVPINPSWNVGAGALYARIPTGNDEGVGAGIVYGLSTYGSADANATLGLGYGVSGQGGFGTSPVVLLGGTARVSNRLSLTSENYFITSADGGVGGLYGVRLHWPRTTFNIASGYVTNYQGEGLFGYIYPIYLDVSYRFGRVKP